MKKLRITKSKSYASKRAPREPMLSGVTHRGHVIRLDPTVKQANELARAAGVARFSFNWGLAEWDRQYKAGEKPTVGKLRKQFNAIKREQFPWIYESPKDANQQAFADLGVAFQNFFDSCSGKRQGPKIGHPTFRRHGVDDKFYVSNDHFTVKTRGDRGVVNLPVIGAVRMQESFRWDGRILSARVHRAGGHWYISIACEVDVRVPHVHERTAVGVDLGLKRAVIASRGDVPAAPKPLKAELRKLRRANRTLHRRKKGSANRKKAQLRLSRIHQRIANIRQDFWHKLTTQLCRENQTVVIEDLSMSFMVKNPKLARAAADVASGMFRPMMAYKAPKYGTTVIVANKFFPSTQRCSRCGHAKTGDDRLVLGESSYRCDACGTVMDRDANAADNLEQYPRLAGNWGESSERSLRSRPYSTVRRASMIADVGTRP